MVQNITKSDQVHRHRANTRTGKAGSRFVPLASRPDVQVVGMVVNVVALAFGITPGALRSRRRGAADVALARQIAMYLLHCTCGLTLTETAAVFRRDRTTAAYGCKRVEDMREDTQFDWRVDHIERAVGAFRKSITTGRIA